MVQALMIREDKAEAAPTQVSYRQGFPTPARDVEIHPQAKPKNIVFVKPHRCDMPAHFNDLNNQYSMQRQ
jgi:hypothetical protein